MYYRLLAKATEQREFEDRDESELDAFEQNRLNKACNTMTADMLDFSENTLTSTTYK